MIATNTQNWFVNVHLFSFLTVGFVVWQVHNKVPYPDVRVKINKNVTLKNTNVPLLPQRAISTWYLKNTFYNTG